MNGLLSMTETKKGYLIILFQSINNMEKFEAYRQLAAPVLENCGARFLTRGMPEKTYEHGQSERVVLLEFDSVAAAISLYESPAYQESLKALGDGAVRDVRIVAGY
ncbi:MAG: DUF1330 domain-containing protein [Leptospiraceae bacterium]|nr:DUF1330 domain-containing protein [Leptospiraceae bacterium]MCB1315176.1 DUF1330 domain-containing protein [Leptospiraceae bacterium]MCB1321821.1 DUF1330 domain-containing protein [Leptospiraceae bacterium]